jgi:hypothetical protein
LKVRWLAGTWVIAVLLLLGLAGKANAAGPGGWDHLGDGGSAGAKVKVVCAG